MLIFVPLFVVARYESDQYDKMRIWGPKKCKSWSVTQNFWRRRIYQSEEAIHNYEISIVVLLDGNSEIIAHVRSNLFYLICIRHLIRSICKKSEFFSLKRSFFLQACSTCSKLPSNIRTMGIKLNGQPFLSGRSSSHVSTVLMFIYLKYILLQT